MTGRRPMAESAVAQPSWVLLAYLVAGIFFILALRGLSGPESSRRGNRIGMIGNCHADHADAIAAAAAFGAGQPPQREDEAYARHEISEQHPGRLCDGDLSHSRPPRHAELVSASIVETHGAGGGMDPETSSG